MWQTNHTTEEVFRECISDVFSPLDSAVSKAFVYVNFLAEQAARADLPSP